MDLALWATAIEAWCCHCSGPQGPLSLLPLTETEHWRNLSILKFKSLMCYILDVSCAALSNRYGTLFQTERKPKRKGKKLVQETSHRHCVVQFGCCVLLLLEFIL